MKRLNAWLIAAIMLCVCLVADIVLYISSGNNLNILTRVTYADNIQNYKVISAEDRVYLGTYQNKVIAYERGGKELWSYDLGSATAGIQYDAEREIVIVGSQGRKLILLDALTGTELRTADVGSRILEIDYEPFSQHILVSAMANKAKGTIELYDVDLTKLLSIAGRPADSCAFAPDGQSFYYGDVRANLIHADLDGNTIESVRMDDEIYALAVSAGTGRVAAISDNGTVGCFEADLTQVFQSTVVGNGRACAISDDGNLIGAGTREGDVYFLDAQGKQIYSTRLTATIQQIVINGDQGFVVPWSSELHALDVSAAEHFDLYTNLHSLTFIGIFVLAAAFLIALALTFGRSRSQFFAFFVSLHHHKVAYLMLIPSFALILLFNYYPIGQAFYFAFTNWNATQQTTRDVIFVGFANFAKMISEGYFLLGVRNMLTIMVFNFLKLLVPLMIAELVFSMNGGKRRYWFRFFLVLPMVVPGVVSALMWKNIYDPTVGLMNQFLTLIGRGDLTRAWLGNEQTALGAIIFMGFPWVNSFAFLVFYGGLINIPSDLFEAAKVDGSRPTWNLTRIHLPLLMPQIKMIVITTFISSVQDYGGVLLLTNGGPGYATYVPGFELYLNATLLGQYGYACALGIVLFVVILAGTIVNLKMKTEEALG